MQRINIAIASPGDVAGERDAILKVFTRWNDAHEHAFLHPVMWESASVPALGDHPQHLLNRQIIDKSELLVAILWSKLGTPTPTARSGTVEEIQEFMALKGPRRVMLYFCKRDLPYDIDPAELAKLQEFKAEMQSQGLYHEYSTVNEFEGVLYRHLDAKVQELLNGQLPLPQLVDQVPQVPSATEKQHADPRLREPIDFGTTLDRIADGFAARMDQFDAIDGCTQDKFLRLGAHVYNSVAMCLDRYLTFSAAGISAENRNVLETISARLKRLAAATSDYLQQPFPKYWADGREISDHLSAHVRFLSQMHRG